VTIADRLARIVLDGRHTAELIAHPCPCDQPTCQTLGAHLEQSTRDMAPGIAAQAFEPRTIRPSGPPSDDDPPPHPTRHPDDPGRPQLADYHPAAQALQTFMDAHRPDRYTPLPDPATDDMWCRNHLDGIGLLEPRYRGDLCRACYDIGKAHGTPPDKEFMRARRDRGYATPRDTTAFARRLKDSKTTKRKKAS
jgi:hypothetical protein